MEDKHQKFSLTWFFRLFLNSQAVIFLLVTLLTFLTIFIFSKISFLFRPIGSFLEIVLLPMILTGLLYYLLNPMVDWMEKHKISRTVGISILFVLISLLIIWGLAVAIPSIQEQVTSFAQNLPSNIQKIEGQVTGLLQDQRFEQFRPTALEMLNKVNDQVVAYAQKFSSSAVNWASNLISTASQIIVAILIMPFILFYLLRDGQYLNKHITQYLPTKWREPIGTVLSDVNGQLSNYVRGQVTVAIIVALMFSVMFSIIGLSYPITLGVMAGFLNLIPYLGSFLAMIPAVILGLIAGPIMLIKVLVVFMIEQTIEGRFVTPLIIGSSLSIHPITILFVLLTAGQMYGVLGVLLGIPIYASIKVLVKAAFEWYKAHSSLYEDEENEVVNEQ
ncbi:MULTISPECIES: AI-2E family transporter [Streptococcus]|uniref:AI-2E family transporter n=1 Tax=Streptococcus suis TaxID=1307 RepID=A0A4T2H0U3_STRSU|nr:MULTISPECIES: AI-2E family transporter [Streptococcus]MBL6504257.1 AI-2E family transporter [Streptococcus suis]MBM0195232.1 AI-2E family transporter [Streptococcus suis]MBM7153562.1 AI-2E family transporter [Streptococcus suis]MBM7191268.1 AI-2E family transporter [Streptococcus suis]MBM7204839.1 AI-2E family transporter [Streptococcus suis]